MPASRTSLLAALFALVAIVPSARCQIQSYTIGLDVNCPYGLTECWTIIREGLENIDTVAAISPRADPVRGTCEMRPRRPELIDPAKLAESIVKMGVGTRLRGLEITADGTLERRGNEMLLHIEGLPTPLPLLPLREKIQMNNPRKRRETPSETELSAHQTLLAETLKPGAPTRLRITGPLAKPTSSAAPALEVRTFQPCPAPPGKS